jgi:hypothetical protein
MKTYQVKQTGDAYISDDGQQYKADGEILDNDTDHDSDVTIYWDILDNFDPESHDESDACDWGKPESCWHYALGWIDFEMTE